MWRTMLLAAGLTIVLAGLLALVAWQGGPGAGLGRAQNAQPENTATASATPCPQATPELFQVEPIPRTTSLLTQTVVVRLGNGEQVSVVLESGVFSATGTFDAYTNPARVEVALLPNTEHHLEVTGLVRTVQSGGCTYGGYTLTTTRDRNGQPLVITQQSERKHLPLVERGQ